MTIDFLNKADGIYSAKLTVENLIKNITKENSYGLYSTHAEFNTIATEALTEALTSAAKKLQEEFEAL